MKSSRLPVRIGVPMAAAALLIASAGAVAPAQAVPNDNGCAARSTVHTTDLTTWDFSETRATGHQVLVADGLHLWTQGTTSTDKAAGYYPTSVPLSEAGTEGSIDYVGGGLTPGLQYVADFDADGVADGILVGESVYTDAWWLSNAASQFAKDGAPHTGGGYGSNWYGTTTEWSAAFPDAIIVAVGYSLGSGVFGAGTITSMTLACTTYTFGLPVVPEAPVVPADVTVLLASSGSATFGAGGTAVVTLPSTAGTPSGAVRAQLSGTSPTAAVTIVGQRASIAIPATLTPGYYTVQLSYVTAAGQRVTVATSAVVAKASPRLRVTKVAKAVQGKKAVIKASVTGVSGVAPTGKVSVYLGSHKVSGAVKVKTGPDATSTVRLTTKKLQAKGKLSLRYSGSTVYSAAEVKAGKVKSVKSAKSQASKKSSKK